MKEIILLFHLQVLWLPFCLSANGCTDIRKNTCSDCIQQPGCAWCADDTYTKQRCDTVENHAKNRCSTNKTANPTGKSEYPDYKELDLTDQIYPRTLNLTVRVGEPFSFKINVRPARNYPVDLYYLMDFSSSMADDLENLKLLAGNISRKLHELTKNYRLAFGSYVDKVVQPYVKLQDIGKSYCRKDPKTLEEKCDDPPYDYKHHLDFTNDATKFQKKIDSAVPSRNHDVHEGLFDSLMQIAVCEKELKWKPKETSRRMVLIATDGLFHIAGEGKFGGAIEPNDERCHLVNEEGVMQYSKEKSLALDYPSVNQIFQVFKKNGIQPIFAIGGTDNMLTIYQNLADTWKDLSATTGVLGKHSENITSLIEESYKKIVSTVRFTAVLSKGVKLKLTPNCGNATKLSDTCKGVIPGNNVTFDVSVTVDSCDHASNSSFKLVAPGIGEVDVNLDIICGCDCQSVQELNSSRCSGNGTFVCGACQCYPGRTGESCQCNLAEGRGSLGTEACKLTNSSNLICEANGECVCGECQCKSIGNTEFKYYGKYCQCSNFNCEQFENQLCGGPRRGKCKCGKCYCNVGYEGSNCADEDCSFNIEKCIYNGLNCSGNGVCDCGICKCEPFYEGKYCKDCLSCDGKCIDYNACVLCEIFGYVPANKTKCEICPEIVKIESVPEFEELGYPAKCEYTDSDGCTYRFTYGTKDSGGNVTIYALTEKDCPEGPNVLLIILVVIGTILGIGILLLILWKVFTAMVDRREYEQFEKEKAEPKWHRERNPLFKPATSTVLNPTYVGSKTA